MKSVRLWLREGVSQGEKRVWRCEVEKVVVVGRR